MIELIGIVGFALVGGIAFLIRGNKGAMEVDNLDIVDDFKTIKRAMLNFKKDNINKIDNLSQLERYLEKGKNINFKRYSITPDEKYLVISNVGTMEVDSIIDTIGGSSRKEGDKLYLSFLKFKVSEVDPVAVITMHPNHDITTTTNIEWSHSGSQVEAGDVRQEEWENKKSTYTEPGTHKVSLRVMDRNENWSEWTSVEFEVSEVGGIREISAGSDYLLVVYNSGKVGAIGGNKFGQLGNGTQSNLKEFTIISNYENVEQLVAGDHHVLLKDHQGKVACVGNNDFGQLGLGNRLNVRTPQKLWGLERVKKLAAGGDYSAAVLMTGAVLTWGKNEDGQLGEDKPLYQELPRRVKNLSNVKSVTLGPGHMAAVHYDGSVTAWGDNSKGQVGSGYKGKMIEPTTLTVKGARQAVAGKDFTIVLLENGKLMGWGSNLYGQLGMTGVTEVLFPKEIPKLKNIVKIAARNQFVLALTDIGEVYTWGRYDVHQDDYYPEPVAADGLKYVKDIAASDDHAFLLTENDEILTWGSRIDLRAPLSDFYNRMNATNAE